MRRRKSRCPSRPDPRWATMRPMVRRSVPRRQYLSRTDLESQLRREHADHHGGTLWCARARQVLRRGGGGYKNESGVAKDLQVETFAAVRLDIDSWRWNGVPFFILAGKCLPTTTTEVLVDLKRPPVTKLAHGNVNYLRLRLRGPRTTATGRSPSRWRNGRSLPAPRL
jgi:hypothetical protein